MKIDREKFLNDLLAVKAGLSPREFIEQSSCFVFQDRHVMTFNDEVACRKEVDLDVTGAVQATTLLEILEKMDDKHLEVMENDEGELEFKGKRKAFGVTKDAEVFLPIDKVEVPKKWKKLEKEFTEAVGLTLKCVSEDESKFLLTCVNIHPDYIEACDNLQIMRCRVSSPIEEAILVRGTSIAPITSLGMDKISFTKSWVHFKNHDGLILSCRSYAEDYPTLDKLIEVDGNSLILPKGVKDASARAAVFAEDRSGDPYMNVSLRKGKIRLAGQGLTGWYREVKEVTYEGPEIDFVIRPQLLQHISENYAEATISDRKLKAEGANWVYVTVLGIVGAASDSE